MPFRLPNFLKSDSPDRGATTTVEPSKSAPATSSTVTPSPAAAPPAPRSPKPENAAVTPASVSSSTNAASAPTTSPSGVQPTSPDPKAGERRRRRRAKLAASVLIRGGVGTAEAFQEVCSSIDVSRDGLLFNSGRGRYWIGQTLDIIFPYSSQADASTPGQRAQVVRTIAQADKRHQIAVHFFSAMQQNTPIGGKAKVPSSARSVILIVDSDPGSAAENRAVLEKDGYQVISVGTAHLALEVLKTETPSLILAEAEGEELGGRDLCLILRKNDRLSHIPIVLLNTAEQTVFENAATIQHGAIMSLVKPYRSDRLQHVVKLLAPPPSGRSAYGAEFGYSGVERTI